MLETSVFTVDSSGELQLPGGSLQEACLIQLRPASLSQSLIPLTAELLTIGRDATCRLEICDEFISRLHAVIDFVDDEFVLSDAGSRNGTFVNDQRITRHTLVAGDRIQVGNHIFKYLSSGHVETQYHETVQELMTKDGMAQIYNRRYFEDAFRREVLRATRHARPLALVLLDVDHFKTVNDAYGHVTGDDVLKEMCARMRHRVRADEIFARVGGEEFAVVLCETTLENAVEVAETLRHSVADVPFSTSHGNIAVTISLGIGHRQGHAVVSADELFETADKWMYEAKRAGRNCTRYAGCGGQETPAAAARETTVI